MKFFIYKYHDIWNQKDVKPHPKAIKETIHHYKDPDYKWEGYTITLNTMEELTQLLKDVHTARVYPYDGNVDFALEVP